MAKDKHQIKEFEAVPNPWQSDQTPKTVQFDPKTGPKGKATIIQKEGEAHNADVEKADKEVKPIPIEEATIPEKPKRKAKAKTEEKTSPFPCDAEINAYGFLGFKKAWLEDLGWEVVKGVHGQPLKVEKNADGSLTLRKA